MAGTPKRMNAAEHARDLAALIEKRISQGMPKTLIARRLGISPKMVNKHLERAARLAKVTP